MTKKKITFTVTPDSGIDNYWIAVGREDITLINGKGSISLIAGQTHWLSWWMEGTSGAKLDIVGKDPNDNLIVNAVSSIPTNESRGGGTKCFKVN